MFPLKRTRREWVPTIWTEQHNKILRKIAKAKKSGIQRDGIVRMHFNWHKPNSWKYLRRVFFQTTMLFQMKRRIRMYEVIESRDVKSNHSCLQILHLSLPSLYPELIPSSFYPRSCELSFVFPNIMQVRKDPPANIRKLL